MNHRTTFSSSEASLIRKTLRQIRESARDDQKRLRADLRKKFNFYISDFTSSNNGFTAEDFNVLVADGRVKIT